MFGCVIYKHTGYCNLKMCCGLDNWPIFDVPNKLLYPKNLMRTTSVKFHWNCFAIRSYIPKMGEELRSQPLNSIGTTLMGTIAVRFSSNMNSSLGLLTIVLMQIHVICVYVWFPIITWSNVGMRYPLSLLVIFALILLLSATKTKSLRSYFLI